MDRNANKAESLLIREDLAGLERPQTLAKEAMRAEIEAKHRASLPWAECPLEEKIERIRREMQEQRHYMQYGMRQAVEAHQVALHHEHSGRGEVLVPASSKIHGGGAQGSIRAHDPLA